MDKHTSRQHYLKLRGNITDRHSKDSSILQSLTTLPQFLSAQKVLCYASIGGEVSTHKVFEAALTGAKEVWQPAIIDDLLGAVQVTSIDMIQYLKSAPTTAHLSPKAIIDYFDLIIAPLVAADAKCNRLGRGGGYYDKLLSLTNAFTIGLAYDEQISKTPLTQESHDIPLDIIVSPTQIYRKP